MSGSDLSDSSDLSEVDPTASPPRPQNEKAKTAVKPYSFAESSLFFVLIAGNYREFSGIRKRCQRAFNLAEKQAFSLAG